jgi:hypothetical protein
MNNNYKRDKILKMEGTFDKNGHIMPKIIIHNYGNKYRAIIEKFNCTEINFNDILN